MPHPKSSGLRYALYYILRSGSAKSPSRLVIGVVECNSLESFPSGFNSISGLGHEKDFSALSNSKSP